SMEDPMTHRRKVHVVAGLGLAILLWGQVWPSWALFGLGDIVFDPTNYAQHLLDYVEFLAIVANTVSIIKNQITDLTALDGFALDGRFNADLDEINTLLGQAQGLGWDMETAAANFDATYSADNVPCTSQAFLAWQQQKEGVTQQEL